MSHPRIACGISILAVVLAAAAPAAAQEPDAGRRGWGTVMIGPTFISGYDEPALMEVALGGEFVWRSGWGFAFDFAVLADAESFTPGALMVSPAVFYEFDTNGKLRPYLRGGISLINFYWPMADFGGGVNYWFNDNVGLKGELRHSRPFEEFDFGLTGIRVGLNYRF